MNEQRKKLTPQASKPERSRRTEPPREQHQVPIPEMVVRWKRAITALRAQRFESLSAATSAVIDEVLRELPAEAEQAKTRSFLEDLFATDPGLQESLRRTLSIREV